MILYDMKSGINWVRGGEMSAEQMKGMPEYKALFSTPCVLYDDGVGGVYSFEPLADAAARWCVPQVGGTDAVFAELKARMDGTYKAPGVAEVEEKADAAQTAAQTASETAATAQAAADEAKGAVADATSAAQTASEAAATAQATADEAKATADTAAASMNEYLDALLGLDATDETEATDA